MRFPRSRKIFHGQFDAAPIAGVFFLLVIFLLLNSSLVFPPGVRVRLPEADDLPGVTAAPLIVSIDANEQFYFENQIISEVKLKERLHAAVKQSNEPLTLVVQGDQSISYGSMVAHVQNLARAAGIRDILLATRPPVSPALIASPIKR